MELDDSKAHFLVRAIEAIPNSIRSTIWTRAQQLKKNQLFKFKPNQKKNGKHIVHSKPFRPLFLDVVAEHEKLLLCVCVFFLYLW